MWKRLKLELKFMLVVGVILLISMGVILFFSIKMQKAQLLELAKDYDADYYVNNQLMPAVLKIMGMLGYSLEDLEQGGKQAKLF